MVSAGRRVANCSVRRVLQRVRREDFGTDDGHCSGAFRAIVGIRVDACLKILSF